MVAAIFPGAQRGAGDAVRAEEGGTEEIVAPYLFRGLRGVLVRAHQPYGVRRPLQEPPTVGVRCQADHKEQVCVCRPNLPPLTHNT